jgi:hypothetical protein
VVAQDVHEGGHKGEPDQERVEGDGESDAESCSRRRPPSTKEPRTAIMMIAVPVTTPLTWMRPPCMALALFVVDAPFLLDALP